jgi:hypothetical protein
MVHGNIGIRYAFRTSSKSSRLRFSAPPVKVAAATEE